MIHCELESGDSIFSQYFQINSSLRVVCAVLRGDDAHLLIHAFVLNIAIIFCTSDYSTKPRNFPFP